MTFVATTIFPKKNDLAEPLFFRARVADEPQRTAKKWKIRLETEAAGSEKDALEPCSGNLLAYFDTTFLASDFGFGDRLFFEAKAEKPMTAALASEFDFAKYLHFQNIHFQCFVDKNDLSASLKNEKWSLRKWAIDSRRRCLDILKKRLGSGDEFAVASGLTVGYRADLSDEIRSAYLETGAMHALAVSGMHVAGVYFLLEAFFKLFSKGNRWRRALEPTVSIAVIWAFALVTGGSASVVRAAVMFSFFLIGRAVRRDSEPINSLAASAFLLLVFEPKWLFDIGFQLSYLAVAGIVLLQKPIEKLVFPPKWAAWAWKITSVGLAAQIAVAPVSLVYFHQFSTFFWLSGLVVVPLGMPALVVGFAVIFFNPIFPTAAEWLGKCLFWLVRGQNEALFWIQKLPFSLAKNVWMNGLGAVALYFFIASTAFWLLKKRPRALVAAASSLAFFAAVFCFEKMKNLESRQIRLGLFPRKNELSLVAGDAVFSTDAASFFDKTAEKGAKTVEKSPLAENFPLEKSGPVFHFLDKKVAAVGSENDLAHEPIDVDFVWLRGSPRLKIEEIAEIFPFKKALFDASVPRFRARVWADECRDLGMEFHDVRTDGPFVFDF